MKKALLSIVLACFAGLSSLFAQTTLSTGDIAFTGFNSDASPEVKGFSFIILRAGGISAGTEITFTDCGWKRGSCGVDSFIADPGTQEGEITWTASSAISFGNQVSIATVANTASTGTVTGDPLNVGSTGDQILAFQGTRASHTMLAGIHMNANTTGNNTSGSNWDDTYINQGQAPLVTQSNRPDCLTDGTYSLFITSGTTEYDNARYNCTTPASTSPADYRAAINNSANWETDDASSYAIPPSCTPPLPVEWLFFNADKNEDRIILSWATASEYNNDYFQIESRTGSGDWKPVGKVDAAGNSNTVRLYNFTDLLQKAGAEWAYYRIKQVDMNGASSFSDIRSIALTPPRELTWRFDNEQDLILGYTVQTGQTEIQITDLQGRIIYRNIIETTSGMQEIRIPAESWNSNSIYQVVIQCGDSRSITKVFKVAD